MVIANWLDERAAPRWESRWLGWIEANGYPSIRTSFERRPLSESSPKCFRYRYAGHQTMCGGGDYKCVRHLLAFGPRVGKGHAAAAFGHTLIEQGHALMFRHAYQTVQQLLTPQTLYYTSAPYGR
jgi:hypothetical protein